MVGDWQHAESPLMRARMSELDGMEGGMQNDKRQTVLSDPEATLVLRALYHAADELHSQEGAYGCGEDKDGNIVACELCEAIAIMAPVRPLEAR